MDFLQQYFGNDIIVQKGWFPVGYLVFQRDPEMCCDSLGRRNFLPMGNHGILHPCQVIGVVHMPHEVNIIRLDRYAKLVGDAAHGANNNVSGRRLIGQKQKSDRLLRYGAG